MKCDALPGSNPRRDYLWLEMETTREVREVMTRNPIAVRPEDDLALARQIMLWAGVRHLPVVRDGRLVGMLSDRDLLQASSELGFARARTMPVSKASRQEIPSVGPHDPVEDAAAKMVSEGIDGLPVLDHGKLVGIVTTTDLLLERSRASAAESAATPGKATARMVMTPDPEVVAEESSLYSAAQTMAELSIRHLPVIDPEGCLVGMLSDRDVRAAIGDPIDALRADSERESLTVENVMSSHPVRVPLDAPLEELANVFTDERVGAIVVVDEGNRPVGIVSYVDLLAWLVRSRTERVPPPEPEAMPRDQG